MKDCKSTAGRPQLDVVLMFKVIFLQRYYGLGDKQIQYQIIDRTGFRQFLCIHTVDEIPDEKTVWHVKNLLSKAGTFDALFDKFRSYLNGKGRSFNEGKIIDASFVEAPRQRNTREENERIKSGKGEDLWNDDSNLRDLKAQNDNVRKRLSPSASPTNGFVGLGIPSMSLTHPVPERDWLSRAQNYKLFLYRQKKMKKKMTKSTIIATDTNLMGIKSTGIIAVTCHPHRHPLTNCVSAK